jgi:hypothetical protein
MDNIGGRARRLVIVASEAPGVADDWATHLVQAGWMAVPARSPRGCLRLATALGPDTILVDDTFPASIERLIAAHPTSRQARLFRLAALRGRPADALVRQATDESDALVVQQTEESDALALRATDDSDPPQGPATGVRTLAMPGVPGVQPA